MTARITKYIPYFVIVMFTSALWVLALADGTVEVVKHSWDNHLEKQVLISHQEKLQLEVQILELEIKKRAYRAQINYLENQGFK